MRRGAGVFHVVQDRSDLAAGVDGRLGAERLQRSAKVRLERLLDFGHVMAEILDALLRTLANQEIVVDVVEVVKAPALHVRHRTVFVRQLFPLVVADHGFPSLGVRQRLESGLRNLPVRSPGDRIAGENADPKKGRQQDPTSRNRPGPCKCRLQRLGCRFHERKKGTQLFSRRTCGKELRPLFLSGCTRLTDSSSLQLVGVAQSTADGCLWSARRRRSLVASRAGR